MSSDRDRASGQMASFEVEVHEDQDRDRDHDHDQDRDKRAVIEEDEFEDEEALFAKHDDDAFNDLDPNRKTPRLKLLPVLCILLLCLAVVFVVLAVVFSLKPGETLDKCVPQSVPVPDVSEMTLAEKVGQMIQVNHLALKSTVDVATYFIGSVLSGGGGAPSWGNKPEDWADMVDDLQAKAMRTRLRIPIVYGADAVHGHNNVYGAVIFPHHVGMGASHSPQMMQRIAAMTAQEMVGTGVRWNFAPMVAVCRDPRWGRCYESYSSSPNTVTLMALPEILGYQSPPDQLPGTSQAVFVAATAKHFVADGGTAQGRDRGNAEMAEAELRDVHLPPYITSVTAGVQAVMVSYSSWNSEPMTQNRYLVTEVLKQELGFLGVAVSDWGAVELLPGNLSTQITNAVNAGIDMVMNPSDYAVFSETLSRLVSEGAVPMQRIDDAVSRILTMKSALGLFNNSCARREFLPTVGSDEHRQTAREAVRASLVLLKNAHRAESGKPLFPLALEEGGRKLLLVGRHANDLGLQCGGWTVTWQGSAGRTTTGTTILEGFQEVLSRKFPSATVLFQESYDGETRADYGIVVVGEDPYAEYYGDSLKLALNDSNVGQIESVCSQMPCIVVLVAGRSLDVFPVLSEVDALVVVWLPGSEGGGVADVLVDGDFDFKGRLPFSWFKSVEQLPLEGGEAEVDALFVEGFGLDKNADVVVGFP